MKRFRFRKLICASAIGLTLGAATLGTSVLSEAAGPRQIFSGLWNRRPTLSKVADSKLNPRTWGNSAQGEKPGRVSLSELMTRDESSSRNAVAVSSSRPELYEDPFAVGAEDSASSTASNSVAAVARKSAPQPAPSPRQRREAERSNLQNRDGSSSSQSSVFSERVIADRGTSEQVDYSGEQQVARRNDVPRLPDGLESSSTERSPATSRGTENQFSDGFDQEFQRLIRSVIAETEEPASGVGEPADRKLAGGRDSFRFRGPVTAPRIPVSKTEERSPLANDANSVEDLIESSRRNMATAMTLPPNDDEVPLITGLPGQSPISLTEATGQSQLRPLDRHQAMMVPSMRSPGGSLVTGQAGAPDLRSGWSGDGTRSHRVEAASQLGAGGPVRPRVISNGAPPRSVPNNRRYERMSYNSDEGPLFGTVVEAPLRVPGGGQGELEIAADARQSEGVASAPIIDWSLDANSNDPASASSIPWGFAGVLVASVSSLLAILLLRKRQVVTVVTSGTDARRETA
jgi:hypothetical protein